MLTEMQVKNAKAKGRDYKLADSEGLYLYVTAKGHCSRRMNCSFAGKERRLVLVERAVASANTFEALARGRYALQESRWTQVHASDMIRKTEAESALLSVLSSPIMNEWTE